VAHITTVDMGLRYLLLNQLSAIREAGYEVWGISSPGPGIPEVEATGVRHVAIPMRRSLAPLADLRALWQLYRVMRRERFDIVHTHTPKAALLGQYAAFLARIPLRVHTIHGLYFPGHMNPRRRWAYVLLERMTMVFSHLNLSQNPEDVPTAIRERICPAERIRVIGNGIDVRRFDPAAHTPERRRETRARIGIGSGQRVVGMVARFVAEKGYREMLEAARLITQRLPDARFIFIGATETEKRDALDPRIISDMGLDGVALFLGQREDMPDLYAAMDVLALPSYREGFPRAPMEAAAMGIPSVVTDIRGCRQVVDQGVTGYLVSVRNAEALAERLIGLLEDEDKREAFGQAARQKALGEFDERHVFSRVLDAYGDLLRQSEAGRPVPLQSDT
ncbi:MAG: glycosyltransferase family 4 protein, partial [Chloroflexi bacterium]|nr:glycosyltransferase family 4 protein [Chloroflexota bacterium]